MEIDWQMVGIVALIIHTICFLHNLCAVFYYEKHTIKGKIITCLLSLVPIISQIGMLAYLKDRYDELKTLSNGEKIPKHLEKLVNIVLKNNDYIIDVVNYGKCLYNKPLNLYIYKDRISIKGNSYKTNLYKKEVNYVFINNEYKVEYEIYSKQKDRYV